MRPHDLTALAVDGTGDRPTVVGQVTRMWRYPVKSMRGEQVDVADVHPDRGFAGDREYAVAVRGTTTILSAKREERLLMAQATTERDGRVVIRLPAGTEAVAGTGSCDEQLSSWLDRDVSMIRVTPGVSTSFDRVLTMAANSPVERMTTQPGSFFDGKSPVHAITEQGLLDCATLVPTADWSIDRFRPNILVPCERDDESDTGWVGGTLAIGDVKLWVRREATRCIMPARAQPGIPRDRRITQAIARHRGNVLGTRLNPVGHGQVRVGQTVSLLHFDGPPPALAHLVRDRGR